MIPDVANGLANAMRFIPGLYAAGYPIETVDPPCVVVIPDRLPYNFSYGGHYGMQSWRLRLLVGRAEPSEAWADLFAYAAPTGVRSIKAAVEMDETLGGAAQSTRVAEVGSFASYDYGEQVFLGCEFVVEVVPSE